jgi:hypothetical protein
MCYMMNMIQKCGLLRLGSPADLPDQKPVGQCEDFSLEFFENPSL